MPAALARRDQEGGIAGQAPLGAGFRTVAGPTPELLQQLLGGQTRIQSEPDGPLAPDLVAGL